MLKQGEDGWKEGGVRAVESLSAGSEGCRVSLEHGGRTDACNTEG